jgi:hypothetical protein
MNHEDRKDREAKIFRTFILRGLRSLCGSSFSNLEFSKGEIDEGGDQLREAAADGAIVVDMDKLGTELVTGEPAGFFLGKRFGVGAVDSGIDFLEVCDYIVNRELGEINHLGSSRVSREGLPPSNTLPGNPFLFSGQFHQQAHRKLFSARKGSSGSSRSMKIGDAAVRSWSRA